MSRRFRRCALSLSLGLALAPACSSSSSTGTGGNGGGTGGAHDGGGAGGGSGGAGGGGLGGATGSCGALPSCVATLMSSCAPAGGCLIAASMPADTTNVHNLCYGNGVKANVTTINDLNADTGMQTITFKYGGATCYSLAGSYTSFATSITYAFMDPAGTTVASYTADLTGSSAVIVCGGQTYTVTDFGTCGSPTNPEGTYCGGGACSP